MSTTYQKLGPSRYGAAKRLAQAYLRGEFGSMSVPDIAGKERVTQEALYTAIRKERAKNGG